MNKPDAHRWVVLAILLARFAVRDSAGKPLFLQVLKASCIIGKLTIEIINRVPKMLRDGLSAVHNAETLPFSLRDVKG